MDIHTHYRPLDAYENVIEHLRAKHIRITETRKAIIAYLINSTLVPIKFTKICCQITQV